MNFIELIAVNGITVHVNFDRVDIFTTLGKITTIGFRDEDDQVQVKESPQEIMDKIKLLQGGCTCQK